MKMSISEIQLYIMKTTTQTEINDNLLKDYISSFFSSQGPRKSSLKAALGFSLRLFPYDTYTAL